MIKLASSQPIELTVELPSPRIAVVIPCYNQAHFLPEAVASVCAQSYRALEIVIVDDGSPDDTAEVARRLADGHPERQIRVVQQRNQGLPAARNRGIEAINTEYVLPLDADDTLSPLFVEKCVAALDAHPEYSIAYGGQQDFGEGSTFYPHPPYDFPTLTRVNLIGVASAFRRKAWEDVGGYSEHLCVQQGAAYEDWDFWIGCGERGHFGLHVPDAIFYYRIRTGSMLAGADDTRWKAHVVLNHPVLYSLEQTAWARAVLAGDRAAAEIDQQRYIVPALGRPPVGPVRSGGAFPGARTFATAALAHELLKHPQLLSAYCRTFSGSDDATLVVCGTSEELQQLGRLLRDLGLDDDAAADLLGVPAETIDVGVSEAATMVDALLTLEPAALPVALPRVTDAGIDRLREHADARVRLADAQSPAPSAIIDAAPAPRRREVTAITSAVSVVHRGTPEDIGVLRQIFADKSYSLQRFERWPGLRRYADMSSLGARPLIVDRGANIGASSMYFSMTYSDARIVAIEPEVENFNLLSENTARFAEVRPVNKAIASEPGSVLLYDPGAGAWGYRTGAETPESNLIGEVATITVDDVLRENADAVPFILKVDIEGAESDLFSRNTQAISRFPLVIVELHDWMLPGEETSRSFLNWHLSERRDLVHHGENMFSLASTLCQT
jgi:FkbM family methyltransferase